MKLDYPAIARGENEFVYDDDDVLVMKRTWGDEVCYVAINFNAKSECAVQLPAQNLALGSSLSALLPAGTAAASLDGSDFVISPYTIAVLLPGA